MIDYLLHTFRALDLARDAADHRLAAEARDAARAARKEEKKAKGDPDRRLHDVYGRAA